VLRIALAAVSLVALFAAVLGAYYAFSYAVLLVAGKLLPLAGRRKRREQPKGTVSRSS